MFFGLSCVHNGGFNVGVFSYIHSCPEPNTGRQAVFQYTKFVGLKIHNDSIVAYDSDTEDVGFYGVPLPT